MTLFSWPSFFPLQYIVFCVDPRGPGQIGSLSSEEVDGGGGGEAATLPAAARTPEPPPMSMLAGYAEVGNRAAAVRSYFVLALLRLLLDARMALHPFLCLPRCNLCAKVCPHPGGRSQVNIAPAPPTTTRLERCENEGSPRRDGCGHISTDSRAKPDVGLEQLVQAQTLRISTHSRRSHGEHAHKAAAGSGARREGGSARRCCGSSLGLREVTSSGRAGGQGGSPGSESCEEPLQSASGSR